MHERQSYSADDRFDAKVSRCPLLVLGVGNILLRDEGIGVRVVEAMEEMELPSGVELYDGATAGFDLLDVIAERQKVIVIDAVESTEEPGTIMRLTLDELDTQRPSELSMHDVAITETFALAGQLGTAPREVVVIGVVPRVVGYGLELSEEVGTAVPRVIEAVLAEIALPNERRDDACMS